MMSIRTEEVLFKRDKREWVVYRENGRFAEMRVRFTFLEFLLTGRIFPPDPSQPPRERMMSD